MKYITYLSLLLSISFNSSSTQFGHDSHQKFVEIVTSSHEKTYHQVLNHYDQHLQSNPNDILALSEKCKFIDSYSYAESELLYFESLEEDLSQCKAEITEQPETHPERILYELNDLWGEDAITEYHLIFQNGLSNWTDQQKLRFFQWAEYSQSWTDQYDPIIPYTGYQQTRNPQFTLGAAIYEFEQGQLEIAQLLAEQTQAKTNEDQIKLTQLFIDLGSLDQAIKTMDKVNIDKDYLGLNVIKLKASLDPNYIPNHKQLTTIKEAWQGQQNIQNLFNHAINNNLHQLAIKVYQSWTQDDFWQDPFNHHKYNLYQATGEWRWELQDFYSFLVWLSVVFICILMAFVVIGPIHYRGLYRRVHGKKPLNSMTQWNLKHALFLCSMFFLGGTILTIIYQYEGFYSLFFMDEELPFSDENGLNSRLYFGEAILMLIMSALIFKKGISLFKISFPEFFKSFFATLGIFVLFKILIVGILVAFKANTAAAAFDLVQLVITDINNNYGMLATYLSIALLTPVIEEYLFRGVLLNSFTKHISFGWANTIQAALFALIHDNPEHYFHHFLLGLIVGYMVKTQKHLYGAITFHALNNALAIAVLIQ